MKEGDRFDRVKGGNRIPLKVLHIHVGLVQDYMLVPSWNEQRERVVLVCVKEKQ